MATVGGSGVGRRPAAPGGRRVPGRARRGARACGWSSWPGRASTRPGFARRTRAGGARVRDRLHRLLAACDLAITHGGLTTTMTLTAHRAPVPVRPAAQPLRAEPPRPAPARRATGAGRLPRLGGRRPRSAGRRDRGGDRPAGRLPAGGDRRRRARRGAARRAALTRAARPPRGEPAAPPSRCGPRRAGAAPGSRRRGPPSPRDRQRAGHREVRVRRVQPGRPLGAVMPATRRVRLPQRSVEPVASASGARQRNRYAAVPCVSAAASPRSSTRHGLGRVARLHQRGRVHRRHGRREPGVRLHRGRPGRRAAAPPPVRPASRATQP